MTDLISRLADDILALINAQPRSPTKEELEGVLRQNLHMPIDNLSRMLKDAEALSSYPIFIGLDKASGPDRTVKAVWDFAKNPVLLSVNDCQGELAITQEDLVKAADEVCAAEQRCSTHADGQHSWWYDALRNCQCCSCGATKP